MVNVPVSYGPDVQLNPLTNVRETPYAEVRQNALPGALAHTMGALSEMQQRADNLRVEDSLNQLRSEQTKLEVDYGTRLGANVLPKDGQSFTDVYGAKFDDLSKGLEDSLTDRQRKAFRQKAGLIRVSYLDGVAKHESHQIVKYGLKTDESTIALEKDNAARNIGNRMALTTGLIRTRAAVDSLAAQQGWDEGTRQGAMTDALSNYHAAVIGGALDQKNTSYAKQYLEEKQGDMDPAKVSEIRKVISQTGDAIQQQKDFEDLRDSGKTLEDQLREVDKRYAEDPHAGKAVKADLVTWHNQVKASQSAEQQTLSGKVQEMYRPTLPGGKAMSITSIKQTPEWAKIEPKERQELLDYWERMARGHDPDNDPTTAITRFATYMKILDDPKGLVTMSDGQLAGLNRLLGPRLTMKLMEDKRQAAGDLAKLANVTLEGLPWRDISGEYGIKTKGTLTPEQNATLGQIYDKATDRIRSQQKAKGRPLNQEEKEAEFRTLLERVPEKRSWYNPAGWVGSNTTPGKYLFQLTSLDEIEATPQEKTAAVSALIQANLRSANPRPQEEVLTPQNVQMLINAQRQTKP